MGHSIQISDLDQIDSSAQNALDAYLAQHQQEIPVELQKLAELEAAAA
jgi:hypothetical protein